jgi:flagellar basal-body rod protein FlgG
MSTSAMHVAKTGLTAQQYKMQVIANNLANVNTTGFKRDRANFESLFYQIVKNCSHKVAW